MSLPEDIIDSVQRDVRLYDDYLKQIALAVINQGISQYPIFVAHREVNVAIGRLVVDRDSMRSQWSINASLLEEFVQKKLIEPTKVSQFVKAYKQPKQSMCLFVLLSDGSAGFAFYPYRA